MTSSSIVVHCSQGGESRRDFRNGQVDGEPAHRQPKFDGVQSPGDHQLMWNAGGAFPEWPTPADFGLQNFEDHVGRIDDFYDEIDDDRPVKQQ